MSYLSNPQLIYEFWNHRWTSQRLAGVPPVVATGVQINTDNSTDTCTPLVGLGGKPFRQFLLGETPKTGLPHHGSFLICVHLC
ncbi:hypothetical protein [Mastigocladopsis repens]|uniref:hypothetical protein n=1 Tax=Mastigocladopsis repens TaxID=221287 RepID=UPI0012EAB7C0|nr:hypothetical protein [Mastigocladopsis repens]